MNAQPARVLAMITEACPWGVEYTLPQPAERELCWMCQREPIEPDHWPYCGPECGLRAEEES